MTVAYVSQKGSSKFTIDVSAPVADGIFDIAAFEKYLKDRVKVNGRANNLPAGGVTVTRKGDALEFSSSEVHTSKRYLKYLTKKFLKKHSIRNWLRVVSTGKDTYVVKYFNVGGNDEESDAE